ncbi:MAG: hypothetical protein HOO96_19105 [Polyangiaceae bacterium]|nr:hypothetical protein [Polyangiaceae bacterium]
MDQTPSLLEAFREDPFFILLSVVFGLAALVIGALALLLRSTSRGIGAAALLVALCALGAGSFGMLRDRGHANVAATAPGLTAQDSARVIESGHAAAQYNLFVGLVAALPGGVLGLLAIVLGRRRSSQAV